MSVSPPDGIIAKEKNFFQINNSPIHKSLAVSEKVAFLRLTLTPIPLTRQIWHRVTFFSSDT
jgi:hypothetical protein